MAKKCKYKSLRKRSRTRRIVDICTTGKFKLRTGDDPVLKTKCNPVDPRKITDPDSGISIALKAMMKILVKSKNGVGLSANQAGYDTRMIIVYAYGGFIKMINPEVIDHSTEKVKGVEGCLSYPGESKEISRYKWIEVEWLDEDGVYQNDLFSGQEAVRVQHEMDHLEGVCQVHEFNLRSVGLPQWLS